MVSVCEPSSNSDIAYDFVDIGSGTSTKIVRAGVCSLAAGIIELVKVGVSHLLDLINHLLMIFSKFYRILVIIHKDIF